MTGRTFLMLRALDLHDMLIIIAGLNFQPWLMC